jgi:DNA replication protein DnaC
VGASRRVWALLGATPRPSWRSGNRAAAGEHDRNLVDDRGLFQKLAQGDWIEVAQNLIIEGSTGVGKSWLACALGHKACRDNRSVLYQRIRRLFTDLALVTDGIRD